MFPGLLTHQLAEHGQSTVSQALLTASSDGAVALVLAEVSGSSIFYLSYICF